MSWTCGGVAKDGQQHQNQNPPGPHEPYENFGSDCVICSLTKEQVVGSSQPPGKAIAAVATVAILAALGFGAYKLLGPKPCPAGQQNINGVCAVKVPPSSPTTPESSERNYTWEPERFTWGQRTLFPGKGNVNRDNGIQAFQQGNYADAVDFFKRAVAADRNDPEVLILYNNTLARRQGSPLTLAAVVPVDNRVTSAEEMLRGIAQAQNQFNQSGGRNGRLLEIVIANDGNKPDIAKKVAQELVDDPSILGVIGHNSSSASKAGLEIYEQAGLAMISPTSTSTSLTGKVFFRTVPSDAAAGEKLAQYAKTKLNLAKVVIFYNPNSIYSTSLKEAFENRFQELGGRVEKKDISNPSLNAGVELSKSVFQERAEAALLFPDTDYTSVAIEIARANSSLPTGQRLKLLGGDSLYSPTTLIAGGESVEGLILVVPWFAESPQSQPFKQAGENQWGGLVNWRTAESFDAAQAFIKAFSDNSSPATVLEQLRKVNLSPSETSGEALQFTPQGERQSEPILVQVLRGGIAPPNAKVGYKLLQE